MYSIDEIHGTYPINTVVDQADGIAPTWRRELEHTDYADLVIKWQ